MARLKEPELAGVAVSGTGTQDDWNTFHGCLADLMREAAVIERERGAENEDN